MPTTRPEAHRDEVLADCMRHGDAAAFCELTRRYWNAIHRLARNFLDDDSAAGDLTEATFLSALRSASSIPADAPFRVWLYRIAMTHALLRASPTSATDALVADLLAGFDRRRRAPSIDWSLDDVAQIPDRQITRNLRDALQ